MKQDLDKLLGEWRDRAACERSDAGFLRKRIVNEVRRQQNVDSTSTGWLPVGMRIAWAGLGAAACLFVVLARFSDESAGPDRPLNGAMRHVRVSDHDVRRGVRLFDEMQSLFSDQFRWVAESNGDMTMGVERIAGGPCAERHATLVRLVVVEREVGADTWQPVWNADVMLRGEELAEVAPNPGSGNKLSLWVYPMEDGKLAVEGSIALQAPFAFSTSLASLADAGQPAEVATLRTGGKEYRVLQTVSLLTDGTRENHG